MTERDEPVVRKKRKTDQLDLISSTQTKEGNNKGAKDGPSQQSNPAAQTTGKDASANTDDFFNAQEKARKPKSKHGDLDELFGKLKKAPKAPAAEVPGKKPAKRKKAVGNKDDIFGTGSGKARRKTADGLTLYTEDELNTGKGGDTPLCPFDCKCCF
ncbi:g10255 [Coccomyxa elongata]